MLRVSKTLLAATAAVAMLTGSPAFADGLGTRITDASTKLDQDVQACRPVDLGEYTRLLHEAGENKIRATKAAKKNVPVDMAQVDADLAAASALFNRAQAALVQQCMRAAQQAAQPQPQAVPAAGNQQANATPPKASDEAPGGNEDNHPLVGYGAEAFIRHSAAIDCGNADQATAEQAKLSYALDELRKRLKAAKKAGPLSAVKPDDVQRQINLLESFQRAAEQRKPKAECPPPPSKEAQTQPEQPNVPKSSTQGAMNFDSFNQQMLAAHNQLRTAFGAPPLRLDEVLVQHATERAVEMARAGDFTHAARAGRGTERENIAKVPTGYGPLQVFERWAREQSQFKPGIFPNVCTTGDDCSGVLHLTAILWPDTVGMGCGSAAAAGYTYVVCRMNPGGNKDGKPVGLPVQIASKIEQPTLPTEEVFKNPMPATSTPSRPGAWYVGGDFGAMIVEDVGFDYGLTIPSSADSQIALNHDYGYDGALFVGYDLGAFRIESEVAYKRADLGDVHDVPEISSGRSAALTYMINGLLDFGDDDGVSGFVGGGAGVARVDYNNVRAFSNQGAIIDDSDTRFAWQIIAGLRSATDNRILLDQAYDLNFVVNRTIPYYYTVQVMTTDLVMDNLSKSIGSLSQPGAEPEVDTAVDQPKLPNAEVYKSASSGSGGGTNKTDNVQAAQDPDEEFWAASAGLIAHLSEDTRLDLGAGAGDFGGGDAIPYNGGIFWDPVSGVTVGAGATYVDLFDDPPRCRLEPSVALSYDLGSGLSTAASAHYVITLTDLDTSVPDEVIKFWANGGGSQNKTEGPDTKVDAPVLPTKEVYNPADLPKCTLEIM